MVLDIYIFFLRGKKWTGHLVTWSWAYTRYLECFLLLKHFPPEGQYSPVGAINMQSPGGCDVPDLQCCHLRELPRQRKATDAAVWLHLLWQNGDTQGVENKA